MANIAVDIDDTLYSFGDEAREILSVMVDEPELADYKTQLSSALYAKWDQWRTPNELCGFDSDGNSLWLECIRRCHDDKRILAQTPFVGSIDICNELLDQGHNLIYISNRATETEEATRRWLSWHGFLRDGFTKLIVTSGDKRPFIKDCKYIIDDRVKTVVEFVFDYDWASNHRFSENGERKAFVRVGDYNGGLTDVPNLYLAHTWAGLRRYMVKTGLLPSKQLVSV